MQDQPFKYAVGLDVGTTSVKCVVGHLEEGSAAPTIIGVGRHPNHGMRKGVVVNMVNTAQAIDKALEEAERASGYQINSATLSINGSHITGMASRGVVAVGGVGNHEITAQDLSRAQEAATVVQLPPNREILDVTPRGYQLDGQEKIKDPLGMVGVRLEVDAYVITALSPHVKNLQRACEITQLTPRRMVTPAIAAMKAMISDQLAENGVLIMDIGGATTNLAVYEEGDLQHVSVLPVGSTNITNDLAIGLKTDIDVAEAVKLQYSTKRPPKISVQSGGQKQVFDGEEVEDIVSARLEEIFDMVNDELKKIGRQAKLPGGVVLCGGGANLSGVAEVAKDQLLLPARLGRIPSLAGLADQVSDPAFAAALGLMMDDLTSSNQSNARSARSSDVSSAAFGGLSKKLGGLLKKFRV